MSEMSQINTIAFMAGYMTKEAKTPPVMGPTPMPAASAQPQKFDVGTFQPGAVQPPTEEQIQQQGAQAQPWMSNKDNRDMMTIGGGAAIGGALGALGGGDLASTLMGTALGGIVGWLAKHFFGGDNPSALNKAYDYAQAEMAKGTLGETAKNLATTNAGAAADFKDKKLEGTADKATQENADKQNNEIIDNASNVTDPTDIVALESAVKSKKKGVVDKAKEDALPGATVSGGTEGSWGGDPAANPAVNTQAPAVNTQAPPVNTNVQKPIVKAPADFTSEEVQAANEPRMSLVKPGVQLGK